MSERVTTPADVLADAVAHITTLVDHYHRDAPFRAPETVPEYEARLLNSVWSVLTETLAKEARDVG